MRWHRVGTLSRNGGARVVYEADQPLTDRNNHEIVPGELHTVEKVHLETETSEIRGTWPLCRRDCRPFRDEEIRLDPEVAG